MRYLFLFLLALSGRCSDPEPIPTPVAARDDDALFVAKTTQAELSIDRSLYTDASGDTACFHFIVHNLSADTIGFSLDEFFQTVYENQWGFYDTTYRMIIDEMEMIYEAPDAKTKKAFREKFTSGKLIKIEAGGYYDYYSEFATKKYITQQADTLQPKWHYLIVSLKGQLLFTNGKEVTEFHSQTNGNFPELVVKWPPVWKTVPKGTKILRR
jgi:hypothetical protein